MSDLVGNPKYRFPNEEFHFMAQYIFLQVVYLSWYWRYSDRDLLVHKPLPKWTSDDVAQWLIDMGAWTQPYLETVNQKDIGRC